MKVTLLENKRENFKGLLLELSPEERTKFPKLPRVFAVNSKSQWIDFSGMKIHRTLLMLQVRYSMRKKRRYTLPTLLEICRNSEP